MALRMFRVVWNQNRSAMIHVRGFFYYVVGDADYDDDNDIKNTIQYENMTMVL